MDSKAIIDYCLGKPGAWLCYPFGDTPVCVKVGPRLFAQLYPKSGERKLTLNCEMMTGDFYRTRYPRFVIPGYHCPGVMRPYFNTLLLEQEIDERLLKEMIDHSYKTVLSKLTKTQRAEVENGKH